MIFRHFADERTDQHSYLIAEPSSRQAAIVNPVVDAVDAYRATLSELGLSLVHTLHTDRDDRSVAASQLLASLCGARPVCPGRNPGTAVPGARIALGDMEIEITRPPRGHAGEVAFRLATYLFAGSSVLIDWSEATTDEPLRPEAIFEDPRPASAPGAPGARTRPIENHRRSRAGVCLERLILEDLHTSLAESRFTPKEARMVGTYIRAMEENGFKPPSAASVSEMLENVDRTAVHVLVHNIRWKQIDLGRLPLLLAGQTSKWLRGLQTKPEFTAHEREFLRVYLHLLEQKQRPPSGPEIAEALDADRSVQWVRKRAHTIRRKQREFAMPELILTRKPVPRPRSHDLELGRHRTPCTEHARKYVRRRA